MKNRYLLKLSGAFLFLIAAASFAMAQGSLTMSKEMITAEKLVDLTAEGTLDWAVWTAPEDGSMDAIKEQKDPVVDFIKGLDLIGTPPKGYEGYDGNDWYRFNWTNGVNEPTKEGAKTGVFVSHLNNGMSFTVPADAKVRTLKVYADAWNAKGKMVATLSDGSAAEVMNNELEGSDNVAHAIFTISYKAGSAGQKLTVKYTTEVDKVGGGANVSISAVTLAGPGFETASGKLSLAKEAVTAEKQIDLTAEGTLDWAQFTAPEDGSMDVTKEQKDPVVDLIKGVDLIGTPVKGFEGYSGNDWYRFSWTNGVNEPSATGNTSGIYVTGVNNGLTFSVPADKNERTVKIYADAWNAKAKLTATLSDGSAAEVMNNELEGTGDVGHAVFTLVYKAASSGQKLTVKLITEVDKLAPGSGGNISIDVITLAGPAPEVGVGSLSLAKEVVTAEKQINFTTEGTLDWAQFTAPEDGSMDVTKEQKDPVVDLIKGLDLVGAPVKGFEGYSGNDWYRFSWTNGVNEPSATGNSSGIYVTGVNNGVSFTVPADLDVKTVKIYADAWNAKAKLTATLSDGSAAEVMNNELEGTGDVGHAIFTIAYKAGSAGQKLTVKLITEVDKLAPGSGGNISIDAITLAAGTTGIGSKMIQSKISVYPNPTNGLVNVKMDNMYNATIQVFDIVGKMVYTKNSMSDNEQIDLSGRKGIYLVKVSDGVSSTTHKVIVR